MNTKFHNKASKAAKMPDRISPLWPLRPRCELVVYSELPTNKPPNWTACSLIFGWGKVEVSSLRYRSAVLILSVRISHLRSISCHCSPQSPKATKEFDVPMYTVPLHTVGIANLTPGPSKVPLLNNSARVVAS
jgi:hypothetical protein